MLRRHGRTRGDAFFILCQFGENSIHLLSGENSQGLGPEVTPGSDGQAKRGHGCIVGCFEYCNDIVTPQRPEKLLRGNAEFFCKFLYGVGSLGSVFGLANSLIGETREDNITRHDDFSLRS
jgi:hypothetical protein